MCVFFFSFLLFCCMRTDIKNLLREIPLCSKPVVEQLAIDLLLLYMQGTRGRRSWAIVDVASQHPGRKVQVTY